MDIAKAKENFVKRRFAESRCLGMEDPEKWLAQQRKASEPDDKPQVWDEVARKFGGKNAELIEKFIDPTEPTDQFWEIVKGGVSQGLLILIQNLDVTKASFLLLAHEGKLLDLLILCKEGDNKTLFEPRRGLGLIHEATNIDVLSVLKTVWLLGGEKGEAVREFLCNLAAEVIEDETVKALQDFIKAVAVSEDGKIIDADHVVVFEGQPKERTHEPPLDDFECKITIFRGNEFSGRQIQISSIIRMPFSLPYNPFEPEGIQEFFGGMAKRLLITKFSHAFMKMTYRHVTRRGRITKSIFFIKRGDIDGDLPDTGEEITIPKEVKRIP